MMEGDSLSSDVTNLVEEYNLLYRGYNGIENSDTPSNSAAFQDEVQDLVNLATKLVHRVNQQNLFSQNEHLTEIPPEHLRFILLPALLGYLTSKLTLTETRNRDVGAYRMENIKKSKVYYKDFLKLCRMYDVKSVPAEIDSDAENGDSEKRKSHHKDAVTKKTEKVVRYKVKKSLDSQLSDLFTKMNLEHIDDDTQREYYTKLIDKWILVVVEELEFIDEELEILEHMAKMRGKGETLGPPQPKGPPSRPFILTKTALQKQVFGAGYPSIPTYTLDEYYDAQVKAGLIPTPGQGGEMGQQAEAAAAENEEIVKEYKVEMDDAETLQKARDFDDWKDDHRRGWGNRKNMG